MAAFCFPMPSVSSWSDLRERERERAQLWWIHLAEEVEIKREKGMRNCSALPSGSRRRLRSVALSKRAPLCPLWECEHCCAPPRSPHGCTPPRSPHGCTPMRRRHGQTLPLHRSGCVPLTRQGGGEMREEMMAARVWGASGSKGRGCWADGALREIPAGLRVSLWKDRGLFLKNGQSHTSLRGEATDATNALVRAEGSSL